MGKGLRALLITLVGVGVIIGAVLASLHSSPIGGPSRGDYVSGLISVLFGACAFVLVYSIREAWWNDWIGRFIFSHVLVVGMLCVPFILSIFFSLSRFTSDIAAWCLLGIFYASAAILLLGTILWLHTSIENARKRREHEAAERMATVSEQQEGPEFR